MNFPITRFAIKFRAKESIQFQRYAGSALRGAFGHALKHITCLTASHHQGQCRCQPAELCLYRQLFDPVRRELKQQQRMQDIPPPFIIEAYSLPTYIEQGQTAVFYMTLIGAMAHGEKTIIELAWRRALAEGFDQSLSKGRARADLISFSEENTPAEHLVPKSKLLIDLQTHVRLIHHGKIVTLNNFSIKEFCLAVVRRYLTVAEVYCDKTIEPDLFQQLYDDISQVHGTADLRDYQWGRYSNRQKQKIRLDGLIGQIQLENVSERLFYYLYLGQWLHVGKGGVFGLGQYTMHSVDDEN